MQTSYSIDHVAGYAGDLADSDLDRRIVPMRNNSGADLPYGRAVAHDLGTGTSEIAAKLPSLTTDKIVGVTMNSRSTAPIVDGSNVNGARDDAMVNVVSRGGVYVTPEDAITPTKSVFVRFGPGTAEDGTLDVAGALRTDGDVHTAWVKKTAYTVGDRRSLAGKVYKCIAEGTSEDSDAPAMTGSTSADVTDGTAHWQYLGICDATTRASALQITGARWRNSCAAGGLGHLELNIP